MSGPAVIGVVGGTGFYRLLEDKEEVEVETPYGPPSAPVHVGFVGDRRVAFLARHGAHHELPAHRIEHRANLWALRSLGVRRILAPFAAGSLQPNVHPGDLVVCDQLVDRTWGRAPTFYDGPEAHHAPFAEPYCAELRLVMSGAALRLGMAVHDTGTVVVVQGPRFSTRAESRWFREQGWQVVNMTQQPERGAWPVHARAANVLLALELRRRSDLALRYLGPMRAMHRAALLGLGMEDRRFGWPLEMVLRADRAGWRIVEVPVPYLARSGRSKVTGTVRGTVRAMGDMSRQLRRYDRMEGHGRSAEEGAAASPGMRSRALPSELPELFSYTNARRHGLSDRQLRNLNEQGTIEKIGRGLSAPRRWTPIRTSSEPRFAPSGRRCASPVRSPVTT